MSKPYYETEEYNEAENELDTYDDPVKLVMEYRISEKHKDNKIADLEAKLAKSEKERELDNSFWKQECDSLQKTLAEKEKEIEQVTSKLQASYEKEQNQKAIEQLEKVKEFVIGNCGLEPAEGKTRIEISKYIKQQIALLKGEG